MLGSQLRPALMKELHGIFARCEALINNDFIGLGKQFSKKYELYDAIIDPSQAILFNRCISRLNYFTELAAELGYFKCWITYCILISQMMYNFCFHFFVTIKKKIRMSQTFN